MKNIRLITGVLALALLTLVTVSCTDTKNEKSQNVKHSETSNHESDTKQEGNKNEVTISSDQVGSAEIVMKDYLKLKDALVADNNAEAKDLGEVLEVSLKNFDYTNFTEEEKLELKDIIDDAVEHAEHISRSDIAHQREHFKILSIDMTDMLLITGAENTLYEQYCPMYDGGTTWLSMSKEVRNPYYGSSMLKCGKVLKEIK